MNQPTGFRMPRLLLPRPGIDLAKWAVIACDQFTSEPEYWQRVADEVGDAPSTLRLIFPEVFLGAQDEPARIERIRATMADYLARGLLLDHAGTVLVERTVDGRTRRGLMLELDLEHYDYAADSTSLIRPTEGTIVARLAPRIAVRSGAALELPHILVLIDDPQGTVIEPIAAARGQLAPLYDTPLMLGGGRVAGHAVDAARADAAVAALTALGRPEVFERCYGVPAGTPPMLFAMGDGNHSLATAKVIWEQVKGEVGLNHPSRWALVEIENIHDAALHFAPIHRVLFGIRADLRSALRQAFGERLRVHEQGSAGPMRARVQAVHDAAAAARAPDAVQAIGLVEPGGRCAVLEIAEAPSPLAVGTLQAFIDDFVGRGGAASVDYVHGDGVLERLGAQHGCAGFHLAGLGKHELLERVVHGGPLPRKTFSMGEAHEKRYYVEARRIR
jgi:hypothetical protein